MTTECDKIEYILQDINHYYGKENGSKTVGLSLGQSNVGHGTEIGLKAILPLDIHQRTTYSSRTAVLYKELLGLMLSKSVVIDELTELTFTRGIHIESLILLSRKIKDLSPSSELDTVLNLLVKYLQNGSLTELLQDQTIVAGNLPILNPLWDQLISILVTLPERVANKLSGKIREPFNIPTYTKLLAKSYIVVLKHIHDSLTQEVNVSLEFSSQLLGRLCLSGHGDFLMKELAPQLVTVSKDSFLWKKILSRLIVGVPDRCLESVLKSLLSHVHWYGHVKYFLGDHIHSKPTLKILITKKFLLVRVFPQINILQNCIGYLADEPGRHSLFLQMLKNLLEVWGDGTALKHRSQDQQLYISSAIMIATGHLRNIQFVEQKTGLLQSLLSAVPKYIECSTAPLRNQGMVVGVHLAKAIEPSGPQIEFEYEETEETRRLVLLTLVLVEADEKRIDPGSSDAVEVKEALQPDIVGVKISPAISNPEDLDSDDEFEPYDQSDDTPHVKGKQPRYVIDCMHGLVDQKDVDWSLACFQNIENFIRTQTSTATEIAPELAKILLHLDNNFAAPDFVSVRFKALVAICVLSPKPVATYLTGEFYEQNYSIRQRLDILEVIATASQELSGLKRNQPRPSDHETPTVPQNELHWKEIVKKRIQANTRRISKGRRVTEPAVTENTFSDLAGYFFYPLLRHCYRKENIFDLFGQESYLLGRLVSTLGIVVSSSANTTALPNLAKVLLEFMLGLRFHTEAFVRQSLLFSLCMIIISVLPNVLIDDFQEEILEYQQWLQSVALVDPDFDCRKLSEQILGLLANTVCNEVQ